MSLSGECDKEGTSPKPTHSRKQEEGGTSSKRSRPGVCEEGSTDHHQTQRCVLCDQPLRDPVSISCGHSFCRQCISTYWEQSEPARAYSCPQCRKRFRTRPSLQTHKEFSGVFNDTQGNINSHKNILKNKYKCMFDARQRSQTLHKCLDREFRIIEGEREVRNEEHDLWQINTTYSDQVTTETPINCNDIFKPLSTDGPKVRAVVTKGMAGIGKTVSVQKFILDWAEGKANQDVDFMFALPFSKLNLIKDDQYNLQGLVLEFHQELKELDPKIYDLCKVLFIFDGFDESRLKLDFSKKESDVTMTTTVDVLIANLIEGNLLPSAHIWLTSRPASASQIPSQCFSRVTELQGFSDSQKEEYFRRTLSDQMLAHRVISHIKTSICLHIMCHFPVFCWVSASVLQLLLQKKEDKREIPKTLTEMYTHFLIIQTKMKNQSSEEQSETDPNNPLETNKEVFQKLSELAFRQLLKGNVMFYEEDLIECGIDVSEVSVCSGICSEIFKEEAVIHKKRAYSFGHWIAQQFFAASYVIDCYLNKNMNQLNAFLQGRSRTLAEKGALHILLKRAMEKTLEVKSGHLDLFICFLHGISLESNQKLLQGLLTNTENNQNSIKKAIKKIGELQNRYEDRCINLLLCLIEINYVSVHRRIKSFLGPNTYIIWLSQAICTALAYMLPVSGQGLDEFALRRYNTSFEGRRRLIPAVRVCQKALLKESNLTLQSYATIASALQSPNSPVRELDLSKNDFAEPAVNLVCAGLKSVHCGVKILRLVSCKLTPVSCEALASVLSSESSHLTELNLSDNDLQDSGVKQLSAGLGNPQCKLQTLRLDFCNFTSVSCDGLASALSSKSTCLRELNLSKNEVQDSGVKILTTGLGNPNCKLEILSLSGCLITEEGFSSLASVLTSNPSHLKKLDLSYNHPGRPGEELLSARVKDPQCKLETLNVERPVVIRPRSELSKYACELTLDPNTAHAELCLSEDNRKLTRVTEKQPYPDHPERFEDTQQVLCREGLTGRCYWEVELSGWSAMAVSVAYKSIVRKKAVGSYSEFGYNAESWSVRCYSEDYAASHNSKTTDRPAPPPSRLRRVGVYLDWPAGTVSFYSVSSDSHTLTHIHTFCSTFTEPLYPGFRIAIAPSSVSLRKVE